MFCETLKTHGNQSPHRASLPAQSQGRAWKNIWVENYFRLHERFSLLEGIRDNCCSPFSFESRPRVLNDFLTLASGMCRAKQPMLFTPSLDVSHTLRCHMQARPQGAPVLFLWKTWKVLKFCGLPCPLPLGELWASQGKGGAVSFCHWEAQLQQAKLLYL